MRRTSLLADLVGMTVMVTTAGCIASVGTGDLQPLVAATGAYGVMAGRDAPAPSPSPAPAGCEQGCKCNGTGEEVSGDKITIVSCRCPDTCPCKQQKKTPPPPKTKAGEPPCQNGMCQWPTRNTGR